MVEVLRIVLGVLVVASLATIVAYIVVFFGVAAWTALTSHRRDPLADELDRVLAGIVGPGAPLTSPGEDHGDVGRPRPREGVGGQVTTPFVRRRFS